MSSFLISVRVAYTVNMDSSPRSTLVSAFIIFMMLVAGTLFWSADLAAKKGLTPKQHKATIVACPQDAKICPDGSSVGRTGPNCAFANCPSPVTNTNSADGCQITGCSRQVCSDRDVITDCIMQPQYVCYASAVCARQSDGTCGWTMTQALRYCLSNMTPAGQ